MEFGKHAAELEAAGLSVPCKRPTLL